MMTMSSFLRFTVAVSAWVIAGPACAQYNLRTVPVALSAGQPFLVVFDDDTCEDFFPNPPGLPPTFTVNGSQVSLAVDRLEVPDCSSTSVTFSVPVPGLAAGNYSLLLIGRALQSPDNYGELQTVSLTVGQAVASQSRPIPSSNAWSLGCLASLMMLATWLGSRRR